LRTSFTVIINLVRVLQAMVNCFFHLYFAFLCLTQFPKTGSTSSFIIISFNHLMQWRVVECRRQVDVHDSSSNIPSELPTYRHNERVGIPIPIPHKSQVHNTVAGSRMTCY